MEGVKFYFWIYLRIHRETVWKLEFEICLFLEYFPLEFDLDVVAGGKYIYSEPILPELDDEIVVKELKKIKLTKTDINRNQLLEEPFIYGCSW